MVKKRDYSSWTKDDLVKEVEALRKQKTYGLVWEKDKTKENFDYYINWDGQKTEEKFPGTEHKLPVLKEIENKEILTDKERDFNLLIEGDNYHALATLNFTHNKSVDVIYIDPPYNTGKKNEWKYNDSYVDAEDSYRHSKWLSFMEKRLKLSKELLKETGIVFISIDDNELGQLKILCDEIFGVENLISVLVWNLGSGTSAGHFTRSHEYVLSYAKKRSALPHFEFNEEKSSIIERAVKRPSAKNPLGDISFPKGMQFNSSDKIFPKRFGKSEPIEVIGGTFECRSGKLVHDVTLRAAWTMKNQIESWLKGKETFDSKGQKVINFFFKDNGVLQYEKERSTIHPKTIINGFTTKQGTMELEQIFGKRVFDFPKPSALIKYLIKIASSRAGIVLDFFAGSGTTGHAILDLNKEDGGNRKFILCTNNENNICTEVCYPRIQKIIRGYKDAEGTKIEGLGGNLKYFKTDFVDSDPTDKNKKKIVDKSTEMICIKENAFIPFKNKKDWKIFENHDYYLGIVFNEDSIEEFVKEAKKLDKKIHIYVFSLDESVPEKEFKDLKNKAKLCPIPEVILHIYRRIFK